jgi:hypothetical protein
MPALVLHTFGILNNPGDHPSTLEFQQATPAVLSSIPGTSGLLKDAVNTFMPDGTSLTENRSFGVPVTPTFFETNSDRFGLTTLSVWDDIESAVGFSFHREHGEAMKKRKDWFQQEHTWPSSVMWWASDIDTVDWASADEKLVELNDHGPSPNAFTFQSLYSADGTQTKLDHERVQQLRLGSRAP